MRAITTVLALVLACGFVVLLAGCNTTKGVGQDIQAAGSGIEDAAQDNGAR
jgi:predicted small secreted protein